MTKCRNCGSGVLEDTPPDSCNNCDPAVQAFLAVTLLVAEWQEIGLLR